MSGAAVDFNISDEVDDEGQTPTADPSFHAGTGDDEALPDDTDRGDDVTPGTGAEGDPDAAAAPAPAPAADDALDPEFLRGVAGEGAGRPPAMVPYARLAEVVAQNQKLMDVLGGVAAGFKGAAAPAPAAPAEPEFDVKAKAKEMHAALLEGDEDKALALQMEIYDHQATTIRAQATAEAEQRVAATTTQRQLDNIVTEAFGKYTFLNDGSEDFNEEALDEVMMYRNHYMTKGDSIDVALQKAIEKVCPQYVEGDAPAAPPAAAPAAAANKVLRNARAAAAQPPETSRAGTPNKEAIDVSKLDLENMDDEKWDALPEAVKAKLRGDVAS